MKKAQSSNLTVLFISIIVISFLFMWVFGYNNSSINNMFGLFSYKDNNEGFTNIENKCDVASNNNYKYIIKPIVSETENIIYYETCSFTDLQNIYGNILNGQITELTINGITIKLDTSNMKVEIYENEVNGDLLKSINFNDIEKEQQNILSLFYISENDKSETYFKNLISIILEKNNITYSNIIVNKIRPDTFINNIDILELNIITDDDKYLVTITFNPLINSTSKTEYFNKLSLYLFEIDDTITEINNNGIDTLKITYKSSDEVMIENDEIDENIKTAILNNINGVTTTTNNNPTTTNNNPTTTNNNPTTTNNNPTTTANLGTTTTANLGTTTTANLGTTTTANLGTTTTANLGTTTTANLGTTTTANLGTTTTANLGTTTTDPTTEAERQQQILDQLSDLYNNDSELSQDMVEAVKTLPLHRRETICRDYCNYLTANNNDFCEKVECDDNSSFSVLSQLSSVSGTGSSGTGSSPASVGSRYSLIDPQYGNLEDYLQSGIYKYMFENNDIQQIPTLVKNTDRASTTNIIQKDTEGVSNIFAPNIFILPKKNGNGYASYMNNDPNNPSYREFINKLVANY